MSDGVNAPVRPQRRDSAGDIPEDPRIVEVVQAYLADLDRGREPDRDAYLGRYPELAQAIAQCLEGLDLVRESLPVRPRSSSAAGGPIGRDLPPNPLGDFQVVRELARGGMGVVYEAVQLSLGRRVALKVLPFAATFDARQLQRFKNEAQAAALLHHTNIVPIYAVGCERGVHFHAMQLIDGQSLAVVIRHLREQSGLAETLSGAALRSSYVLAEEVGASEGPAPSGDRATDRDDGPGPAATASRGADGAPRARPTAVAAAMRSTADVSASLTAGGAISSEAYFREAARLMVQAAEALEHAHQMGVVHRDIKPANLLVNSTGTLWITDFGLAQLQADTGLTRSGDILGTVRYMSPEQTTGQRTTLDHRTDIYSIGATFYELLTLEPAFDGETRQELIYQIVYKEPRAPKSINRSIPAELETIVLKALSKNRAERYATAGEFAADIQRYLNHQPIHARRPTVLDRARKWSRRHPSVVIAGVLLLAVVAVGMSISNRLISQEQQKTAAALEGEKRRANEAEDRFRQARQAVDVLVQMSEEELADVPMAQGTRKRLLETALAFYQEFIEQRAGNPESQAELASVQERVRGILRELTVLQREIQIGLLSHPAVQDDLTLDAEQRTRLGELLKSTTDQRDTVFRETRPRSEAQRRRLVELADRREQGITAVLNANQLQRLRQVVIQSQGLFAFKDPDIVRALGLTPDQRLAIREIEGEVFGSPFTRRGPGGTGPGPRERSGGPSEEPRSEMDRASDADRPPYARIPSRERPPITDRGHGPDGRSEGENSSDERPRERVRFEPRPPRVRLANPNGSGEGRSSGEAAAERGRGGPRPDGLAPSESRWRPHLSRRQSVEKVLGILSDDQKETWRALTGAPSPALDDPPFRVPNR